MCVCVWGGGENDNWYKVMLQVIGASLSKPHTSVTALRMCVSDYLTMDRPLTGNFKSADLQNLYVHVCTSNSNLILKMIMEFSSRVRRLRCELIPTTYFPYFVDVVIPNEPRSACV